MHELVLSLFCKCSQLPIEQYPEKLASKAGMAVWLQRKAHPEGEASPKGKDGFLYSVHLGGTLSVGVQSTISHE